ncbi:HAD-IIIC family phosphatase [Erythrobacter sp. Alg231-14]|uniref:HAD-IIIC family phosphatase n=1 Tax=Erythrobacter sp. Alg231-14 TaxID=1922225 RepID=UPI000D54B100
MFLFDNLSGQSKAIAPAEMMKSDRASVKARSLLSWEEHCVECAAPACYSTCDLYDPTPNGKCRRFDGGIVELRAKERSLAHIKFKKWGKLEARGNATPVASKQLAKLEGRLDWTNRVLNWIGSGLGRIAATKSHANLAERLLRKVNARMVNALRTDRTLPEGFAAEIFVPNDEAIQLQLAIIVDQTRLPRPIAMADQPRSVRAVWNAEPGRNEFWIAREDFAPIIDSGLPFLVQLTSFDERTPEIIVGTLDFVWKEQALSTAEAANSAMAVQRPAENAALPKVKCVVFDLDNTLWDGVLLEGDVTLRPDVKELFEWLDERGILISIASKNAESDALDQLREEGLDHLLLHPQIGWEPKSITVARIASMIDIGTDTLLFVDDNPFERAQVAEAVPSIEAVPDTILPDLRDHPRLSGGVTPESKNRRAMYQQAAVREQAAEEFSDYHRFLADCQIVLEIRPDQESDFERIAELVQRTNQLNFSGRKYDREAITGILSDPDQARFVVVASDRFGSYGTVGFCLASHDGKTITIDDFMLSCRVQGKYVEQALFAYLTEYFAPAIQGDAAASGIDHATNMTVNFQPTARNAAALKVLETLEFVPSESGGFEREITPGVFTVDFMTINA